MRKHQFVGLLLAGGLALSGCATTTGGTQPGDDADYPTETLEITVAFGPGGGVDIMARTIADLLNSNDLYPHSIKIENREGGSGANGYGYVYAQTGNAYQMSATSGSFISTPIRSDTEWSATSFTPVALFGTDEDVLWVKQDSPFKTLEDFITAAKANPPAVAGVGATTIDYIAMNQFAAQAGFDFNYVSHDSGPEAANSLLSDSVQLLSHSASSLYGLYEAGEIRPLVIGGVARLEQLPDTPTWGELGYDITVNQPRGIFLAPGVDKAVVDWWAQTLSELVELPEWKQYLADNFISERVLFGDDFAAYLEETVAAYTDALSD